MPFILSRSNGKIMQNIEGPYSTTGVTFYPGAPEIPFKNFTFSQNVYRFTIEPGVVLQHALLTNLPLVPTTNLIPSALAMSLDGEDWAPVESFVGSPLNSQYVYVAELLFNYKAVLTNLSTYSYDLVDAPPISLIGLGGSDPHWDLYFADEQGGGLYETPVLQSFAANFVNYLTDAAQRQLVLSVPAFIPHSYEISFIKAPVARALEVRYLAPYTFDMHPAFITYAGQSEGSTEHLLLNGQTNMFAPLGTLLHVRCAQSGTQTGVLVGINYRIVRQTEQILSEHQSKNIPNW